ncbi:hypothetical protein [Allopusillimonas ginsengisoli]|uniref:hypothetical protein n=1 Tax=Allopusillimonas ginsengisoli TaxID=453575 RepID=UPI00101ED3C3|nr:hypothetical protein [Allopusillimonas ginsengisoli]TEA80152.1 hypothetical protein ERE07_04325 [Allopusillimonas ginsengisoli]
MSSQRFANWSRHWPGVTLSEEHLHETSERLVLAGVAGAAVIEIAPMFQTYDLLLDVRYQTIMLSW